MRFLGIIQGVIFFCFVQLNAEEPVLLQNKVFENFCKESITIFSHHDPKLEMLGLDNGAISTNGEMSLLKHYLENGYTVFDIGANAGSWSQTVLGIESNVHLFAFEPLAPIFYHYLIPSLSSFSSVQGCYNLALSDRRGKAQFYYVTTSSELSSLHHRNFFSTTNTEILDVEQETLDCFCSLNQIQKIDFLKIDTEGAEFNILKGAQNLLDEHRIVALQFEYGGTFIDAQTTLKETVHFLTQRGYVIFRIIPDGLMHIPYWHPSLENYRYSNYFAILQARVPHYQLMNGI